MGYKETTKAWSSPDDMDWSTLRDALGDHLRAVIATFSEQNPEEEVYGIVISHGQNWELSTYLNTEKGYTNMPGRFRPTARNWPEKTDEELLEVLGRWSFDDWEFGLYEYKCRPEVREVNDAHYELFDRLGDGEYVDHAELSNRFLLACASSVVALERSPELEALRKTDNFEIRFFDANCHEWETGPIMSSARQETDKSQKH
jgi:hypothetical protein